MRVLVACERSQQITAAFRARGHDAFSCDLAPAAMNKEWHIQGDARAVLNDGWDLLIAHPPCDRLAASGTKWLSSKYKRKSLWLELDKAADLFLTFWNAPIPRVAIENPAMHCYGIEAIGRKPDQVVHPHYFGAPAFKTTCWWLRGLPQLKRTHYLPLPAPGTEEHKAWNYVHYAPDQPKRKEVRSTTLPPVAAAIAEQWG